MTRKKMIHRDITISSMILQIPIRITKDHIHTIIQKMLAKHSLLLLEHQLFTWLLALQEINEKNQTKNTYSTSKELEIKTLTTRINQTFQKLKTILHKKLTLKEDQPRINQVQKTFSKIKHISTVNLRDKAINQEDILLQQVEQMILVDNSQVMTQIALSLIRLAKISVHQAVEISLLDIITNLTTRATQTKAIWLGVLFSMKIRATVLLQIQRVLLNFIMFHFIQELTQKIEILANKSKTQNYRETIVFLILYLIGHSNHIQLCLVGILRYYLLLFQCNFKLAQLGISHLHNHNLRQLFSPNTTTFRIIQALPGMIKCTLRIKDYQEIILLHN